MPLILGTNSIKDTGYDVDNSLRFDDGSSDNLSRTASGGSYRKVTLSAWVKKANARLTSGADDTILAFRNGSGTNYFQIKFRTNDELQVIDYTGSATMNFRTTQLFRDLSAWYHIVVGIDTEQGTDTNRVKIYVNGSQVSNFNSASYPSQNLDLQINGNIGGTNNMRVGSRTSDHYFDGYMCEVVWIDGQQLDPTSFGEFDSDSPNIWKPIDVSGLTFGTNGFYLDFEDSSALGNDVSGNNNDFTANNLTAIDQSTDTCTNNFATFNPLIIFYPSYVSTLSDGNLTATRSDNGGNHSTIMPTQGKWYAEFKCITKGAGVSHVGAIPYDKITDNEFNAQNKGVAYRTGGKKYIDSTGTTYGDTWGAGDIISIALNLDDGEAVFYKNGTAQNSGTAISGFTYDSAMAIMVGGGGSTWKWSANFGNPPYSISSGNSDGNGYGNFEYSVPSGYFSLCTKNLAEYG